MDFSAYHVPLNTLISPFIRRSSLLKLLKALDRRNAEILQYYDDVHHNRVFMMNYDEEAELRDIAKYINRVHLENSAKVIQRYYRRYRRYRIRDSAARIIQRACDNWIDKPYTADGKVGISARIGLRALGLD